MYAGCVPCGNGPKRRNRQVLLPFSVVCEHDQNLSFRVQHIPSTGKLWDARSFAGGRADFREQLLVKRQISTVCGGYLHRSIPCSTSGVKSVCLVMRSCVCFAPSESPERVMIYQTLFQGSLSVFSSYCVLEIRVFQLLRWKMRFATYGKLFIINHR